MSYSALQSQKLARKSCLETSTKAALQFSPIGYFKFYMDQQTFSRLYITILAIMQDFQDI